MRWHEGAVVLTFFFFFNYATVVSFEVNMKRHFSFLSDSTSFPTLIFLISTYICICLLKLVVGSFHLNYIVFGSSFSLYWHQVCESILFTLILFIPSILYSSFVPLFFLMSVSAQVGCAYVTTKKNKRTNTHLWVKRGPFFFFLALSLKADKRHQWFWNEKDSGCVKRTPILMQRKMERISCYAVPTLSPCLEQFGVLSVLV